MAVVRKKQDDTNLKILRELVNSGSGGNRQCFDCGQKGPTYVDMTIGSFVCTRCSGVLRGLTPPHRVKSISVATFTPDELEFLKLHGNDICAKTWLGLWDPKRIVHQDQRELMVDKYERKRYYLEPASPLKSLTNATKVSSLSSSNNSISTNGSNSIPNTNHSNSTSNSNKSSTDNSLKSVTLTPPTSLHLNSNGIVNNSRTNNNRQIRYNFKTDENSNKSSSLINGIGNGTSSNPMTAMNKKSLNVDTNSGNPHGFTPDSEFVADFSTANIFNATTQSTPNGIKNHLPASMTNGFQNSSFVNGTIVNHNGLEGNSSANENFADFDHAPIYNAAAAYQNNYSSDFATISNNNYFSANMNKTTYNSAVQNFNNNFSSAMNNNCYNLGDRSNLSNNSTFTPCNNLQWNVWQQFQWPSFFVNSDPNQNRWSLPMSNVASNVFSSHATTNANSAVNSTPTADRYAALKDLDEQLRENKAATDTTFSSNVQVQQSPVNPFKMNTPAQPQSAINPFQASYNQSNSMFGAQSQNNPTNVFSGTNAAFNVQQISSFNGYSTQSSLLANGSNGCGGVGYGAQPITAGKAGSDMNNPFATSSLNSNNPFL